jgi:nucleotide-binding universal stress UspA family protein
MISAATLLVPVERPPHAATALPVARELARLKGAAVSLIHVGVEPLEPGDLLHHIGLSPEDARGLVIDQRAGVAADAVVREAAARHPELIVMCTPARSDRLLHPFGSVAGDVLRAAPCPVVLVPRDRGQGSWALHQLVLPHDGTPTSAAAIAPTVDLASRAGADLVVLHVSTPGSKRPSEPGTFVTPRYLDQPHHGWPLWTREFLDRVRSFGYPTIIEKIRLVVAHGEADAAILEFAERNATDLIALAWRGGVAPERARTMRRVISEASCPVIVFRVQT